MTSERGESPERKKVKTNDGDNDLNDKIIAQLEYYFSDVNVIRDKFMKEEFAKNDGYITIETLLKFARLKALAKDEAQIVDALKDCESEVIELDDEKKKIKRKKPLPSEEEIKKVEDEINSRTLHLSGFPLDYTYDNLVRWCCQYGKTDSIQMRMFYKVKKFKGNILVTFKSVHDAYRVMKLDVLKCKDREIRKEDMPMYHKRKAEMAEKRALKQKAKRSAKD